jgi:hypothetical protein
VPESSTSRVHSSYGKPEPTEGLSWELPCPLFRHYGARGMRVMLSPDDNQRVMRLLVVSVHWVVVINNGPSRLVEGNILLVDGGLFPCCFVGFSGWMGTRSRR